MNFSKFRHSGELSDITVVVDGIEFKLHKFPLYAKSDFFCALAKSPGSDCNRVELKEFPGGPETFGVVADYCYNMTVDISKSNVISIRCAAEVLQMTGNTNLAEVADKFLTDTVNSAKISRASSVVGQLLLACTTASAVAEKANIVSQCCEALIDCWLKPPTKFSSPTMSKKPGNGNSEESVNLLIGLPLGWILKLIKLGRDKGVKAAILAELATKYVLAYIEKDGFDEKNGHESKKADALDTKLSTKTGRPGHHDLDLVKDAKLTASKSKKKTETEKIVDAVIMELPETVFSEPCVSTDWVTKVLKYATSHDCKCRRQLVRLAGERLNSLSSEDLCIISPSVLKDIVSDSCSGDATQGAKACQLVETYMNEMARNGVLTSETYRTLVTAGPPDCRKSYDSLYGILEYVLTAEKDKLTTEQRSDLIETVDFTLLGEATLKRAFETQVVPASFVARGALALCSKLKNELESAKNTVCRQEDELQRLRRSRNITPQLAASPKKDTDSNHSSFSELPVRDTGTRLEPLSGDNQSEVRTSHSPSVGLMTEDVLMAARNKLASSVAAYNTFRPLSADRESDFSYDEDMDFKYDRHIRSYDNARNLKSNRPGSFRASYLYPHRM